MKKCVSRLITNRIYINSIFGILFDLHFLVKITAMKKLLVFLFSIVLLGTACKKNNSDDQETVTQTSMEELDIGSGFNWKTTKNYQLTITGNDNGIIEVISNDDIPYQKAFLTSDVPYSMKLTLPAYEKFVKLKFMDQEVSIELDSETLTYKF